MFDDPKDDPSMVLWRVTGRELCSRDTALVLAQRLIQDVYGEDDLKTQLPLQVSDGGDRWIIAGSRNYDDYPPDEIGKVSGAVEMEIFKVNCRVLRFTEKAYLVPEDDS